MRNIRQHPVTAKEIIKCLDDYRDQCIAENGVGDMRPVLLEAAANIITRAWFVMHDVKLGFVPNEIRT